jgi:opacity protein-like surface antigen
MRKIVLAALFIAGIAMSANAQKGSVLLYGNTTFGTENNDQGTSFSLSPGVGYQFSDNWTVGVDLGASVASHLTPSYQAGGFLRYTQAVNGIFSIYEQLGVGYLHNGEAGGFSSYGRLSANALALHGAGANGFYAVISLPNVGINIKNGFAVNLGFGNIGYSHLKTNDFSASKFSFNFGNGLDFGISKNFGGVKSKK